MIEGGISERMESGVERQATGEIRTPDRLITNQVLYQLSHSGSDSATLRFGIRQPVKTFMTFRTAPHPMANLGTYSLFMRLETKEG